MYKIVVQNIHIFTAYIQEFVVLYIVIIATIHFCYETRSIYSFLVHCNFKFQSSVKHTMKFPSCYYQNQQSLHQCHHLFRLFIHLGMGVQQ